MVNTKQYSLTQKEYTKIILKKKLRSSWWLYALMFVIAVFHFNKFGENHFSTFFVIFAFAYPLASFIYLYYWANSKDHQPIFSKTDLSFDNEYLYFKRNSNESKLSPKTIQRVISSSEFWMLYISKGQFIYVPKNIFHSEEDYKQFADIIKVRK